MYAHSRTESASERERNHKSKATPLDEKLKKDVTHRPRALPGLFRRLQALRSRVELLLFTSRIIRLLFLFRLRQNAEIDHVLLTFGEFGCDLSLYSKHNAQQTAQQLLTRTGPAVCRSQVMHRSKPQAPHW